MIVICNLLCQLLASKVNGKVASCGYVRFFLKDPHRTAVTAVSSICILLINKCLLTTGVSNH